MGITNIRGVDVVDDVSLISTRRVQLLCIAATFEFQGDLGDVIPSTRQGDQQVYDIVLKSTDLSGRTKSYSVDMARGLIDVSREGDNYLSHAVGLAKRCEGVGLGTFSVLRYQKG